MKKITFVALAALTITACSSGPEFEVNGDISGLRSLQTQDRNYKL